MHSIRIRLIVLFIVITTSILAAFGIYAQALLSRELEQRFEQLQQETISRLAISLPRSLWDLSPASAQRILAAEMLPKEVLGILVIDLDGQQFVQASRDENNKLLKQWSAKGPYLSRPIYQDVDKPQATASNLIGKVTVYFTREHIDTALRENIRRRVLEILVIDLILLFALTISLRMVFIPLAQLRDALFALSRHDGDEVEELVETQRSEFGEVVQGFNHTQRKLKRIMARRRQAEEATQQAFTDLQAAQVSLLQSEKMASLGGLVAGVAHEINTPVGIVLTSASVLNDATHLLHKSISNGAIRKSEVIQYMETAQQASQLIMSNAERAATLIQSFKQVAVDQTSEQRRKYQLKEYIDEITSSLHPALKQSGTQVTVICHNDIVLEGYPGAMAQVLTNLTMNALAHAFIAGDKGQIEILAEQIGPSVRMLFKDNGRGISEDHLGKIFDPFFTTRRGQGGTGLGLNIVFNIINKQFGGTIDVLSTPNNGTCFVLLFPCISPLAEPESVGG
ncbi:MAG: HAMP domain-containing histidine kinase [Burkholderiales bacterium]|nr:HAMP domain-containing histidine kinase [Burkholderiales bacterium]